MSKLLISKPVGERQSNLRYWTPKYNPFTSFLLRRLIDHRGRNLESLIFAAPTGRSGTMSLAGIFATIDGCVAYREPWQDMRGRCLSNLNADDDPYARFLCRTVKSVDVRW